MTSPDLTERLRTEQARQHVRSPLVELLGEAADEIDRLRAAISSLVEFHGIAGHGRYVVLCDDLSVITTDELMDGDNVVLDRGEAR